MTSSTDEFFSTMKYRRTIFALVSSYKFPDLSSSYVETERAIQSAVYEGLPWLATAKIPEWRKPFLLVIWQARQWLSPPSLHHSRTNTSTYIVRIHTLRIHTAQHIRTCTHPHTMLPRSHALLVKIAEHEEAIHDFLTGLSLHQLVLS